MRRAPVSGSTSRSSPAATSAQTRDTARGCGSSFPALAPDEQPLRGSTEDGVSLGVTRASIDGRFPRLRSVTSYQVSGTVWARRVPAGHIPCRRAEVPEPPPGLEAPALAGGELSNRTDRPRADKAPRRSSDARPKVFGERHQMSVFVPMRLLGGDDVDAPLSGSLKAPKMSLRSESDILAARHQ